MNKIINWVGGSFFRTIGRLLVYILLGFLLSIILSKYDITGLFNVLDVHAQVIVGYAEDSDSLNNYQTAVNALGFNTLTLARTKNCSSTTSCSTIINDSLNAFGWLDTGSLSLNNYGFASQAIVNEGVTNGHLYSYTGLYCFNNSINATGYTMFIYGTGTAQTTYDGLGLYRLSDIRFIHSANSSSFDYCYQVQNYFESDGKSSWIMQQIRSNSGTRRGIFWGYRLVDLGSITGLTSSQVQNIINNATSSQTTAIQSSITASTNSINNRISQMEEDVSSSIDAQTQQQQANHEETMDTITDDNTSEATSSASNFFSNFSTNQHGLTGIITAPLTAIQSLTSSTCSSLVLPLPFVNQNLTLPCMRPIYDQHFGGFMQLYDIITLGIISYWIMVRIFALVKDFKNPEHDEIEVVDL